MPRPRKTDRELLENAFYDASVEEQAALLHTLTTLHRLKKRQRDSGGREPPAYGRVRVPEEIDAKE